MTDDSATAQTSQIGELDRAIQDAITQSARKMKSQLGPEEHKVFKEISKRLVVLKDALSIDGPLCAKHIEKILPTVQSVNEELKGNAAWDVSDDLKELLPLVATDHWVYQALLEERARSKDAPDGWSSLSEDKKLEEFIDGYGKSGLTDGGWVARQVLTALYAKRNDRGRHSRARDGLRAQYLQIVASVLLLLLLISVTSMFIPTTWGPWSSIVIVFFAGGLGAVLSGTIRIRDVERIAQINAVWDTMKSQVVLGGALAVIVLVTLQTGLVKFGDYDFSQNGSPGIVYLVGLISGYSEPFALSLLDKVAKLVK